MKAIPVSTNQLLGLGNALFLQTSLLSQHSYNSAKETYKNNTIKRSRLIVQGVNCQNASDQDHLKNHKGPVAFDNNLKNKWVFS